VWCVTLGPLTTQSHTLIPERREIEANRDQTGRILSDIILKVCEDHVHAYNNPN
jgi:hypothetical protein